MTEDLRRVLDLVQHSRPGEFSEKEVRRRAGDGRPGGIIERHVGGIRQDPACQRGLPDLPRACQHHDRVVLESGSKYGMQQSIDHIADNQQLKR
jgi:hypothetical protein